MLNIIKILVGGRKMKKIFRTFLTVAVLVVAFSGVAFAVPYNEYQQTLKLDRTLSTFQTAEWKHNTPCDFEVPYDEVVSASITIKALYVSENLLGDWVEVDGEYVGNLNTEKGHWSWSWFWPSWVIDDPNSTTTFDIADILTEGWCAGDLLSVSVTAHELCGSLTIKTSTFDLGYKNSAPVPEPATMILFGSGLIGLAGLRRKKIRT